MNQPNTIATFFSYSLSFKSSLLFEHYVPESKEYFNKICFPGGKTNLTQKGFRKGRYCWTLTKDIFPSSRNCPNCLRKKHNMMFTHVYRCLSNGPFAGSCDYKHHRGNYICCCKEQMCKLVVSWGKIMPSPLSRNGHSAVQCSCATVWSFLHCWKKTPH